MIKLYNVNKITGTFILFNIYIQIDLTQELWY